MPKTIWQRERALGPELFRSDLGNVEEFRSMDFCTISVQSYRINTLRNAAVLAIFGFELRGLEALDG
jgi:hypothetical protein